MNRLAILQRESREQATLEQNTASDYFFATLAVGTATLLAIIWNEAVIHWFLLPLMACGILAGGDVVSWMRGRLDTYDPKGIIGCLMVYGFFITPLLHVAWDRFGAGYDFKFLGDWRPWLGAMAILNAIGLGCYQFANYFAYARTRPARTRWEIDRQKFYPVFGLAIALAFAAQLYFLAQLGGITGIIESYERYRAAFVGMGWLLVFAWPLAILAFIVVTFWATDKNRLRSSNLWTVGLLLSAAAVLHFFLVGWRGSRSATVWGLFWMAGIVHYRFRKLTTKLVATGLVLVLAFMYFYGFYKERGREGLEVLQTPELWLDPQGYHRDLKGMLLGDLARADVNAYILYNLVTYPKDYDYRWGMTYIGGFGILIPRNIWPDRPQWKVRAGSEAQYGRGTRLRSSRVYGLSGEAMLNFGPLGVLPMFALYGVLLGWYRRKFLSWNWHDSRMLLAPFFAVLFIAGLIGDSDNIVFAAATQGTLVSACIFVVSSRFPLKNQDLSR